MADEVLEASLWVKRGENGDFCGVYLEILGISLGFEMDFPGSLSPPPL